MYVNNRKRYRVENELCSYNDTLQLMGLTTLINRREVLTSKFALDVVRSEIHSNMFVKNDSNYMDTRNSKSLKNQSVKQIDTLIQLSLT